MKCPYCLTTIADQATICGQCQSDLTMYTPISDRSQRTEEGFKALVATMGGTDIGSAAAIVLSIVLAFLLDYTAWQGFAQGWIGTTLEILAVLTPGFAALLLGRFSGHITPVGRLIAGLIAGLGGLAAQVFVWAFGALQEAYSACAVAMQQGQGKPCAATATLPQHWYLSAITYPIAGAFLFLSGNAIGFRLGSSPFARWNVKENRLQAIREPKLGPIVAALLGVLTAVLPKFIDVAIPAIQAFWASTRSGH